MKHISRNHTWWLLGALCWVLVAAPAGWARPIVTTLAPASGAVGTAVTITGTGFGATAAQNAVYFDAVRATITSASATQLRVTVPAGAAAAAAVTVINTADGLQGSSLLGGAGPFRTTFSGGNLGTSAFRRADATLGLSASAPTRNASPVIPADFNQDGHLDVLSLTTNVVISYGSGNGGFAAPTILSAGFQPEDAAVGDFTGDGQLDIATLNYGSQDVSLLVGLGAGGFASAQTIASSVNGWEYLKPALLAQDYDGDGRLDLLLSYSSGGGDRHEMLRNTSTGFVASTVSLPGFGYAYEVLEAESFNADAQPDLLGLSFTSPDSVRLSVWMRNAANTGYGAPVLLPAVYSYGTPFVATADVDGDGRRDLVLGTMESTTPSGPVKLYVWRRNASNTAYLAPQAYLAPGLPPGQSTGQALTGLQVADADGDGAPDLVLAVYARLSILRNNGSGTSFATAVNYNSSNGVRELGVGDFNEDGRPDFLTHNITPAGSFDSSLYLSTGNAGSTNNAPTLNALTDLTVDEDSGPYTVTLSGISNGGDAGQAVTITARSSDTSILPNPTVSYLSPTSSGTLRLQLAPDAFGTVTVTVTVSDGQTQNGTVTRSFRVTINSVNDAPTLDPIPDVIITTVENTARQIRVTLSGISAGAANESQILSLSALVLTSTGAGGFTGSFTYTSPDPNGEYQLLLNVFGGAPRLLATVTVTVADGQSSNGTVARTFRVYYNPNGAGTNQPTTAPTLNPIADVIADRTQATQAPVPLAGIDDGDAAQTLPLTVTAVSSDPDLVSINAINYASPAATGAVLYGISGTRSGTAVVTVTVSNGQAQNGSISRSFRVTVPTVTAASVAKSQLPLQLFPNPSADGRFFLETDAAAGRATLTVLDALGREVLRQQLSSLPARLEARLPTQAAPGVYVVRLSSSRGTVSRRLVVQ